MEDKAALDALVAEEYEHKLQQYDKLMLQPGAVPGSEQFLGQEDPDGNQLWVITVMKSQVVDYVKVLKKSGFHGTEFEYDMEAYRANYNLRS